RLETSASGSGGDAQTSAQISQCDRRRLIYLNLGNRIYETVPIEDPAEAMARMRQVARAVPPPLPETGPVVRMSRESTDTGERRAFGRFVARRVITTERTAPSPGASTPASVHTTDGWYIDLPPGDCIDWNSRGHFLVAYSGDGPHDRFQFEERGSTPTGYLVEYTRRSEDSYGVFEEKQELIDWSEAPLDPSLFEIPRNYRPALRLPFGGVDITRPDTLPNRVQAYWEMAIGWV